MNNHHQLTPIMRLGSMFIDHFTMTFIAFFPIASVMLLTISSTMTHIEHGPSEMRFISTMIFAMSFGFSIYINKDFFQARSLGKRAVRLQVFDHKSGTVASPFQCMIRNMTIPLWPLEVLFVLFSPNRRLGDYIAGTNVGLYQEERQHEKHHTSRALAISISILFSLLLALVFSSLESNSMNESIPYIEESFNAEQSQHFEKLTYAKLSEHTDSLDIMFYDRIEKS